MNKNHYNSSDLYERQLLSATFQRNAKESAEFNNFKKKQRDVIDKNDFIVYIEMKFKDLAILRYLFDTSKECNTPMRNSVQITRYIIIKSKNKIMGTCVSNGIILCYSNDAESNTLLKDIIKDLERHYYISLKLEENIMNNSSDIEKYFLSYIIQFTLVCKYLESGKWFHIWDNMDTIIESKFCGNNSHKYFNCVGFKFNILNIDYDILNEKNTSIYTIKMHLKVTINIYKILPIDDICEHMNVYCLPRCSMMGSILNVFNASNDEDFNYRDYWFDIHGYKLDQECLGKIARVKLYKGMFNYPVSVLLRENIYKINVPIKKEQFLYICKFLNEFELLKNSKMNLLKCSENIEFDNIYNDLLDNNMQLKKEENDEFYTKIKSLCNNEFSVNHFKEEMPSNNKEGFYNNGYSIYGNTLTNSMKSINLNFSKMNTHLNKPNKTQTNKNIDSFLKESALNYYSQNNMKDKQTYLDKNENSTFRNIKENDGSNDVNKINFRDNNRDKNVHTTHYNNINGKNMKESKDIEYQNQNNNIDKYLTNITSNYKSQYSGDSSAKDVNFFENASANIIFSKDFQNFLDNLDEVSFPDDKLKKVNFNERDKKRPNFLINNQPNSESNKKNTAHVNIAHQIVHSSSYGSNTKQLPLGANGNQYGNMPVVEENSQKIGYAKKNVMDTEEVKNLHNISDERYKKKTEKKNDNDHEKGNICSPHDLSKKSNSFGKMEMKNVGENDQHDKKKNQHIRENTNPKKRKI